VSTGKERANWAVGLAGVRTIVVRCVKRKTTIRSRRFMVRMPARTEPTIVCGAREMIESAEPMQPFAADHSRGEKAQNAPSYSGSKVLHLQNHRLV
jgi:hypothetical protein